VIVLAATQCDLTAEPLPGRFRPRPAVFRLNPIEIHIPPLRETIREDVDPTCSPFVSTLRREALPQEPFRFSTRTS